MAKSGRTTSFEASPFERLVYVVPIALGGAVISTLAFSALLALIQAIVGQQLISVPVALLLAVPGGFGFGVAAWRSSGVQIFVTQNTVRVAQPRQVDQRFDRNSHRFEADVTTSHRSYGLRHQTRALKVTRGGATVKRFVLPLGAADFEALLATVDPPKPGAGSPALVEVPIEPSGLGLIEQPAGRSDGPTIEHSSLALESSHWPLLEDEPTQAAGTDDLMATLAGLSEQPTDEANSALTNDGSVSDSNIYELNRRVLPFAALRARFALGVVLIFSFVLYLEELYWLPPLFPILLAGSLIGAVGLIESRLRYELRQGPEVLELTNDALLVDGTRYPFASLTAVIVTAEDALGPVGIELQRADDYEVISLAHSQDLGSVFTAYPEFVADLESRLAHHPGVKFARY